MTLSVGMLVEVVDYNHKDGGYHIGVIGVVTEFGRYRLSVKVEGKIFPDGEDKYWQSYMWHDKKHLKPILPPTENTSEDFL